MADNDDELLDDPALNEIRQRQMQAKQGQQQEAQKRQMQERKHMILSQVLTYEARERLSRVRLVKPENADAAENAIISSVQSGQIRSKVDEDMVIDLLSRVGGSAPKTVVKFRRTKWNSDSEEEEEEEEDDDDDDDEDDE
eukprot:TRINITY_DN3117_c1_g1_i2.p1 TRINITY_DN3117_c1_g1~~TRINITY_DN3117_c1_g1_i2.p1  ORF type:complete len:140 (+),score=49.61 TRINITY_DN3117_c1_g1_i2:49-468(+)